MADAGNLQTFPIEVRTEIYKHLLVEPRKIGIMRYWARSGNRAARMDNHHNKNHRREVWNPHQRRWVAAPPSVTSLLLVNKQISREAGQVIYGFNHFEFENAGALESFLEETSAIAHLRHIALIGTGTLYRNSWASMDRCMIRLATAKALRTLEFSHLTFCYQLGHVDMKSLVEHCKPLLEALQADFAHKKLKVQVYDVIKISLPPCSLIEAGFSLARHRVFHRWVRRNAYRGMLVTERRKTGRNTALYCLCRCEEAEHKNTWFMEELNREVTGQLGLDVNEQ